MSIERRKSILTEEVIEPYLSFTSYESDTTCQFNSTASFSYPTLQYKIGSGTNWSNITIGQAISVPKNSVCYFRGISGGYSQTERAHLVFASNKKGLVRGNIMSLIDPTLTITSITSSYQFGLLFHNSLNDFQISLPATSICQYAYKWMFLNSKGSMDILEFNASSLASGACDGMFSGSKIVNAPDLPATYAQYTKCYESMFRYCSNLVRGPKIYATTPLNAACMFQNSPNLNEIEVCFTTWDSWNMRGWLENVSATGTFRCPTALGTDETITRGIAYCPTGWTVINTD